jgi:uncharacterized protein YndB with AHSA1/START domain
MNGEELPPAAESATITLVVRRTINATAERLFEAWTNPAHLKRWWGPRPVICIDAEVDLRVGGGYRIANRFPDGRILWIFGEFEVIAPPHKLVYTWRVDPQSEFSERVTVRFEPRGSATEVIIEHERIPNATARDSHQQGWDGCLDGLANYLSSNETQREEIAAGPDTED